MDDAVNIHGNYIPFVQRVSDNEVLLEFGHYQQMGVNVFRPKDTVAIVNNETLMPIAKFKVDKVKLISKKYILLKTKTALPNEIPNGCFFENLLKNSLLISLIFLQLF